MNAGIDFRDQRMAEKTAKTSVKEMSQIKDDLLQQALQQVAKCSKATQPWSEHAPPPKRELERYPDKNGSPVSVDDSWSWQDDAQSLMAAARSLNIPAYLERSRSGKGGHLWIFFEEEVSAAMARRLGDALITKVQHETGQLGLRSYDRMFPNQDTMPKMGYGNLIALPLQKGPLANGNSAFLDETMNPYPDQWQHLQCITKMRMDAIETLVPEAARRNALISVDRPSEKEEEDDKVDPWALPPSRKRREDALLIPPLPTEIRITLCNFVYVPHHRVASFAPHQSANDCAIELFD